MFDIAARPRLGHSRGMAIEIAEPPYRAGFPTTAPAQVVAPTT